MKNHMTEKEKLLIEFLGEDLYLEFMAEFYCSWADANDYVIDMFFTRSNRLSYIFEKAFVWTRTQKGLDFWRAKDTEWQEFLKQKGLIQ
jgi:hypothetical protein